MPVTTDFWVYLDNTFIVIQLTIQDADQRMF